MRIISLNTWAGKLYGELESFIKRESKSTDIFCFQEIQENFKLSDGQATIKRAHAGIDKEDVMDLGVRIEKLLPHFDKFLSKPYSSLGDRLAIFSKKTLEIKEASEYLLVNPTNSMYLGVPITMSSIAQCIVTPDKVAVLNTHGFWVRGNKSDTPERITQSKRLLSIIHSLATDKVVLIGDFNLLPDTESIELLDEEMRDLIKECGIKTTRSKVAKKGKGKFADYAFISAGVGLKDFRVLDEVVSDHLPLLLDIA